MKKTFFYIFSTLFICTSCTDEQNQSDIDSETMEIVNVENFNAFYDLLDEINSYTESERLEWEAKMKFTSFGTICDNIYSSIDPKSFSSYDDIVRFVNDNNSYLEILEEDGENYCLPKEEYNCERYLMNKDRMFIIGSYVFKKFDDEYVATDIENFTALKNSSSKSEFVSSTNAKVYTFDKVNNLRAINKISLEATHDSVIGGSDTYRIKLWIQTEDYWVMVGDIRTDREIEYTISNYARWLGIWWARSYSTSYYVYLETTDDISGQYLWYGGSDLNVSIKSLNDYLRYTIESGSCSTYYPYFLSYNCWAKSTKGGFVTLIY